MNQIQITWHYATIVLMLKLKIAMIQVLYLEETQHHQSMPQDHALRKNIKEAQPIDLKIASELRPRASPTDANAKSTMEALAKN